MRRFTGYHGSKKAQANRILATGHFTVSRGNEHWLGDGIYFFESDPEAARWWNRIKHHTDGVVVVAEIEAPEDQVLDLLQQDGHKAFETVIKELLSRARKVRREVVGPIDGEAINFLCTNVAPGIKIVRGVFVWPTTYTSGGVSRIMRSHIQLAVRDPSCILSVNLVC